MEDPRFFFLVVLLIFIFLNPDPPVRGQRILSVRNRNQERRHDFDILTNSSYGDLNALNGKWLNLTGFRKSDNYLWDILPEVQDFSKRLFLSEWSKLDNVASYADITGEVKGNFTRSNLSSKIIPNINLTVVDPHRIYYGHQYHKNVTETTGEVSISLHDTFSRKLNEAAEIKGEISIWVKSAPGNGWTTFLRGVHLPSGGVVLSSYSGKFNALPALHHFALSQADFNLSRSVMNKTLEKSWSRRVIDTGLGDGISNCEIIVWMQPRRALPEDVTTQQSRDYLRQVEQEINFPEGAPIGTPPPLTFSLVIFSPDCGYVLESEALYGPKIELFWNLELRVLAAFVLLQCLQIAILKRQMDKAGTPSTRSRISYHGIVIAALGDGMIMFILVSLLAFQDAAFLIIATTTFLSFIHVAVLELKFIFDIWMVQVGDPARAEADRRRRTQPPTSADGTIGLPLPAIAPRTDGATPIIIASDQETVEMSPRESFLTIYSQFFFTLLCLLFFSLWAVQWSKGPRAVYVNILAFAYFSFWWPQIYRNTMRNCRKALTWEYVIGATVLRLVPILYWYFVDRNILDVDISPGMGFVLLGWIWLQVVVLASQQFLGPRLLVKDEWCPPAYDYHPVLREDDTESGGMSIGLLASASEAKGKDDKTRKVFDCAICMNEIDVPVLSKDEGNRNASWLEQRNYMVTPCRHIFHAECLEGWMNLRLVCPVCRESLPPL